MVFIIMKIRDLKKEDILLLSKIVSLNYSKKYGENSKKEIEASFENKIIPPKYLVAEEKGKIFGFAGYIQSWMDYSVYNIFWVNVHPDYQKQNIGSKLVKEVIKKIKSIKGDYKAKMILLTTTKPKFYSERFGFEIMSSLGKDEVLMSLKF